MAGDSCCVVGALAKLAIGGNRLQFIEFESNIVKELSDGSARAIRGKLDRDSNLVSEGITHVDFRIALYMTAQNLDILLPIMGMTESPTDTFTLVDALASTQVILGMNTLPEVTLGNSFVSRWVIRGVKGGDPPRIDIWFRAYSRTEQANGTFFNTHTVPLVEYPYAFAGGVVLTYGGTQYGFNQYALGCNYHLVAEWNNSVNATNICPTDHEITVGAGMLLAICAGTVTPLLTTPFTGDVTGGAFSLAFSRTIGINTYTTQFNISNVKQLPYQPGVVNKHDFERLQFNGRGYANGTAAALTCQNVA